MMAEQQEVQRRINILNHQRAVVERRAKGLSCIDHGFDENCHFQKLYEEISIFFDKDIYPRLSTDTIGFWKNIIKGRHDFCFPENCSSEWNQICYIAYLAILENTCKGYLFDKMYILNENISMLDVKNLIGEALNGVQKSNPMPNSKLDIMECILSRFNSAMIKSEN